MSGTDKQNILFPIIEDSYFQHYDHYQKMTGIICAGFMQEFYDAYSAYSKVLEERLLDLYRKEIDPSTKVLSAEMCKDSNLSLFQWGKIENQIHSEIKNGVYVCTFKMPEITGFINNSTGQLYILDELKNKFCSKMASCKEKSCKSCKNFICNINGKEILNSIENA